MSGIVPATAVIVPVTGAIGALANLFLGEAMPPLGCPVQELIRLLRLPTRLASRSLNGRHDWHEQRQRLSKPNVRWSASALVGFMPTEVLICALIEDAPR